MLDKNDCICDTLVEIDEFFSIEELVTSENLIEVPVAKPYSGFREQWFKCKDCSHVWRLLHPDFPFKGIWRKVV